MAKELIISSTSLETKLAILEEDQVTQIFVERKRSRGILGNIYKGKVARVLPGMQAAFVDIGLERNAFLYVSDFTEDLEEYEELFISGSDAIEEKGLVPPEPADNRSNRPAKRPVQPKNTQKNITPEKKPAPGKSTLQKKTEVVAAKETRKVEKPDLPLSYTGTNTSPRVLPERIDAQAQIGKAKYQAESGPVPLSSNILPSFIPQIARSTAKTGNGNENNGIGHGDRAEMVDTPLSFAAPKSTGRSKERKKSHGRD